MDLFTMVGLGTIVGLVVLALAWLCARVAGRLWLVSLACMLACSTGCAGQTWQLGPDGLTITNPRTGQTGVLISDHRTGDGGDDADGHAGIPGCAEWIRAKRLDTPDAWATAGRAYQDGVRQAFRAAKSAKGRVAGTEARAGEAFGELDERMGETY